MEQPETGPTSAAPDGDAPGAGRQDADVVVVGYGPVGMAVAALLGRSGHRVVVLERYAGLYNLPRAAIFDDETMRTFAGLGIAEELLPTLHVQRSYEWRNGTGDLLIEHDFAEVGRSGWAEWYMMFQPYLEDALDGACRRHPGVEVRFDSSVVGLRQDGSGVELEVAGPRGPALVRAPWVVACDGGNSFVRRTLGVAEEDRGFSEPWMVCDFRFLRPVTIPAALQLGDPAGPTSIISLGPDHHRFSFMLDSAEDFARESAPELVWRRVARYLAPQDAELIRVATYTFRSRVAEHWRVGRVLLAGDAAHQMPPFLGQGMCSGVRDAANLAFKLDLVLRGGHDEALLDTYQPEREPHVRAVIELGIQLGRMQTLRDPERAAARDAELLARRAAAQHPEKIAFPGLVGGLLSASPCAGRGQLSVQGVVDDGAVRGLLDQVVGPGPSLLLSAEDLPELHRAGVLADLRGSGVRVVALAALPGQDPEATLVVDAEGTYRRWLAELGVRAVAVRADSYVFGTADDVASTAALAEEVLAALGSAVGPSAPRPQLVP